MDAAVMQKNSHHASEPTPQVFRQAMSSWPTGVGVLAGWDSDRRPLGLVIGSFISVSLDPMLVGFGIQRSSSTWTQLRKAGRFAISFLATDQQELCWRFASGDPKQRFQGLPYDLTPAGQPVLRRCCAWLDLTLTEEVEAGDHWLALCQVTHLHADPIKPPLAFARGRLNRLEPCHGLEPDHLERWESTLNAFQFGL